MSGSVMPALAAAVLLLAGCGADIARPEFEGGALRVGALLSGSGGDGFAVADRPRAFAFPADHGPHPAFRSEWWYLTLLLEDERGAPLGVQFTLFRQALAPESTAPANRWQTPQVYLAHFAVTDVAADGHRFEERIARGHPQLAGATAQPFQLWLEDWRLEADGDAWRLRAGSSRAGVDVLLDADRPVRLQGDDGLSRKGEGQASYYYSVPGIDARGRVRWDGRERAVTGLGWLDREWSTSVLDTAHRGWDWLALQLDDGRQIMAFQLRREDGARDPYDQGLLVDRSGRAQKLTAADFTLLAGRRWTDASGVSWPVRWTLDIDGGSGTETLRIEALVDDQKMDTLVSYWEGIVGVTDASGRPLGRGYLEMTGYGASRR